MVQNGERGRPPRGGAKTAAFSTRITPRLRKALEVAADRSEHSLSDEIEKRLWQSFDLEEETRKLRVEIEGERKKLRVQFGGDQNFAALRIVADIMKHLKAATGKDWADDPWTFDQLKRGILYLLDEWQPEGEVNRPVLRRYSPSTADSLGESIASIELARLDFENLEDPSEDRTRKRDLRDLATRRKPRDYSDYGPDDLDK